MSTAESWALTPREFQARVEVRNVYEAIWRAEIRNAPHFTKQDKTAWTPDDFLQTEESRMRKEQRKKDARDLYMMNAHLATLRKGGPEPEGLPEWAKGTYWKDVQVT
jgi:hypothetical protein